MTKILLSLLVIFLSVSTCQKKIDQRIEGLQMICTDDTLTRHQVDSLFITDTLSFNLSDDWILSPVVVENEYGKEPAYKYVFIKNLTDTTGTIYTLYGYQDTFFIINKKVIK